MAGLCELRTEKANYTANCEPKKANDGWFGRTANCLSKLFNELCYTGLDFISDTMTLVLQCELNGRCPNNQLLFSFMCVYVAFLISFLLNY